MKHNMNRVLSIVALLMLTIGTWATQTVTFVYKPTNGGTVVASSAAAGETCTLTVTPATGYSLKSLKAVTTLNGDALQAPKRRISISEGTELPIAPSDSNADPSGVTTHTFTMPESQFDVEVTAEFVLSGLCINGEIISSKASATLLDGSVKFTPAEGNNPATLTLNNASITTIDGKNAIESGLENLTVFLVGDQNTITCNGNDDIAFKGTVANAKVSFATNSSAIGSLKIQVNSETKLYSNITPVYSEELSIENEGWTYTIGPKKYGLTVAGTPVTSANMGNVLKGDETNDGKVSFNAETKMLTLNEASIGVIESGLEDGLTVKLVGRSSISIPQTASSAFKSTVSNALLVFTTEDQNAELTISPSDGTIFEGFSVSYQNGLVYKAGEEVAMVYKLQAPQFYSDVIEGVTYFGFEEDDVYYTINYEDIDDVPETQFEENVSILGPCTVTAYSKVGNVQSETVTAKYFGFEESEIDGVMGTKVNLPAIIPTIAGNDGVTISYEGNVSDNKTKVDLTSQTSVGNTTVIASLTESDETTYTLLNSSFSLTVNIVPPAPTISTAEFEGDAITITAAAGLTNPQIYYSWNSNDNTGTLYNAQTPPAAENGTTLYAWVTITDGGKSYTSPKAEQAFNVKKNIANLTVYSNSMLDPESVVYTETTITPTFTLLTDPEGKDVSTAISSSNYDVRIEKYTGTGYTVVGSIVDVGTYMVYAVGKGTYGGEKLIYEALEVKKANIPTPTVATIDGQVYDGQAHNIITVSDVPEETTVKYFYTTIEATDYSNGSFQLLSEPGEEEFHETVPTTSDAGYYALLYRIEGGDNYEDKEAGELIKVAFLPAEITSMTLDTESLTYTGTAQTVTITSVKAGTLDAADYTVTLNGEAVTGDIQATTVGEYTVEVTGKGNFTGTVSATFTIVNRTLAAEDVTFNNHWSTFYSADGAYELPEGIGAYVATGAGENSVTVTQISNIPEKVAVLLNDETTTTSTAVFGTDVKGNMLVHATNAKEVTAAEGDFYGLFNGRMKRVMGTIPAGKNYLLIPAAVNVNAGASQLTIVIDGETTGVNDVRSKKDDVRGDVYDLQGRKVQKLSKKGLYLNNGRKVVVK